jgi:hypothetical protein
MRTDPDTLFSIKTFIYIFTLGGCVGTLISYPFDVVR